MYLSKQRPMKFLLKLIFWLLMLMVYFQLFVTVSKLQWQKNIFLSSSQSIDIMMIVKQCLHLRQQQIKLKDSVWHCVYNVEHYFYIWLRFNLTIMEGTKSGNSPFIWSIHIYFLISPFIVGTVTINRLSHAFCTYWYSLIA